MLETGFKPVCTSCIALSVATNGNPLASSKPFPISMRTSLTQRGVWKGMLEDHHYLHRAKLYGKQIKYLVESTEFGWIGARAFSSAAWRVEVRDERLGWDDRFHQNGLSRKYMFAYELKKGILGAVSSVEQERRGTIYCPTVSITKGMAYLSTNRLVIHSIENSSEKSHSGIALFNNDRIIISLLM